MEPAAVVEIHQLLARYGHLIDHRRWEEFAALFVEDATIDYAGSTERTVRSGRAAIVDWFREVGDRHPSAHLVTNVVVEDAPDTDGRITVHSKFIAPFTRPGHVPRRLYGGDYRDEVVHTPDGWRFAHKSCTPTWQLTVRPDDDTSPHRRSF